MDRSAFEHLYLHANSIAALAFLRGMARLLAMPAPTEPSAEMQEFVAGIEHDMNNPESFNWSAFDGMDEEIAALAQQREQALAADLPFFAQCVEMTEEDEHEDGMPDVAAFLVRAQAAREPLAPRIDDSFAKVDFVALGAALAKLPSSLPPLTGSLSAADLERWIELFEANDEAMQQAVEETRKPEPMV